MSHDLELLLDRPFQGEGPDAFNALALDLFRLHARRNPVYGRFLEALGTEVSSVTHYQQIPALPIGLFRNHRVLLEGVDSVLGFTSSGTTGATTSTHHVPWPGLYERSFMTSFTQVYGPVSNWRSCQLTWSAPGARWCTWPNT